MPRKARVWYPGAIYHIMCRGNHRHEIFRDNEDREVYLTHLKAAKDKHGCYLLSYCLMTNHVHLQVETTDIPIGKMMKQVNMMYAIFFNKKYHFVGHLFQGRYRSELIKTDSYNLDISRYIHLNPVNANMVEFPEEYSWSSYRDYVRVPRDKIVSVEKILQYFPGNNRLSYQKFVERGLMVGGVNNSSDN